jgi:hypothetical protein
LGIVRGRFIDYFVRNNLSGNIFFRFFFLRRGLNFLNLFFFGKISFIFDLFLRQLLGYSRRSLNSKLVKFLIFIDDLKFEQFNLLFAFGELFFN